MRICKEKERGTVEGARPAGLAVNQRTGRVYASPAPLGFAPTGPARLSNYGTTSGSDSRCASW